MSTAISFTRLRLVLSADRPFWSVPADYYRALRSAVYGLLRRSDADLANFLHERGFSVETPAVVWEQGLFNTSTCASSERFKLFCFSSLVGYGRLQRGKLVFADRQIVWFFVTPVSVIGHALIAALRRVGQMRVARTTLSIDRLDALDDPLIVTPMTCRLLSPLVVSIRDPARSQRRYLLRGDDVRLIGARLRDNLQAKHRVLYGRDPAETEFHFQWDEQAEIWPASDQPTRLVRLSAPGEPVVRVRGSLGGVRLSGSMELQRIALYCGLGQYNSAGMGFLLPEQDAYLLTCRDTNGE